MTDESIDVLRTAIGTTNFEAIRSRPFLGMCPTAFDGQELVYIVERGTRPGADRVSCDVEVDPQAPLFSAIHTILGASVPVPGPQP